jgi:hypothetical protein
VISEENDRRRCQMMRTNARPFDCYYHDDHHCLRLMRNHDCPPLRPAPRERRQTARLYSCHIGNHQIIGRPFPFFLPPSSSMTHLEVSGTLKRNMISLLFNTTPMPSQMAQVRYDRPPSDHGTNGRRLAAATFLTKNRSRHRLGRFQVLFGLLGVSR